MSSPITYPKRLIEVDLPIKRISEHARREKSIRHGHISTLHIWWARRPLAACRAVICAALWPDPVDPLCPQDFRDKAARLITEFAKKAVTDKDLADQCSTKNLSQWMKLSKLKGGLDPKNQSHLKILRVALLDFIADFANWDNSTEKNYLETSRALTQAAHEALGGIAGTKPLVIDPFAGGGSIPLEALRVGADAFASDLNPVAVLLNKVVLEYIPKYGQRLADELRKWGKWVKEQAEKELAEFYPKDPDGTTPIAYLWARTITCEGPGCGAKVPLIRSLWLAKRGDLSIALRVNPDTKARRVEFEIVKNIRERDIGEGTVRRGSATCPCCGYTTHASRVRDQFKGRNGGTLDSRLIAVVTTIGNGYGKVYRIATERDEKVINKSFKALSIVKQSEPDMFPEESLPYLRSIFNIHLLDVKRWCDLFNTRQMLSLILLMKLVREASNHIDSSTMVAELKLAVSTCLALSVDRVAAQFNSLSWWQPKGEFTVGAFGRQALGIIWDYSEIRPVGGASGDFDGAIDWIVRVIESEIDSECGNGSVALASATNHPLPDDSAPVAVTDPPYYDSVPYADLSDFFYVFLKRVLLNKHKDLFVNELTPKHGEIVQLAERNQLYSFKSKEYFEEGIRNALSEIRRVLVPTGICVVVFAHKTTEGWEAMLSSVIDSGWVITASWPIDTERAVRMRAYQSAALGSSVHLVCRPRENPDGSLRTDDIGDWRNVLQELPTRIHEWMPRLASEGVVGADAIFACLGPALEIFSRYSRVEKASGEPVSLKEYLEYVWAAVAKEALGMIFEGADATGFEEDARLTAMWLWTLFAGTANHNGSDDSEEDSGDGENDEEKSSKPTKITGYVLEYDAARKIAQGLGAHLENLRSLVETKGDKARLLPASERAKYLFGKDEDSIQKTRKKKSQQEFDFMSELKETDEELRVSGGKSALTAGTTVLDQLHQSMLLFAAGRGEALKRFLVEQGVGRDQRFWGLAQAFSALYPSGSDEKRWVDGVLARKKGLGF